MSHAVIGAGAMGAALGSHWARCAEPVTLLATGHDEPVRSALADGRPHPALGIPLTLPCRGPDGWAEVLAEARVAAVCVSTPGLANVLAAAAPLAPPDTVWLLATKGWQEGTLRSPHEVAVEVLGPDRPVVSLGGPALAAEIVVGAPTALICAAADVALARRVAATLRHGWLSVDVTDDVVGTETCSAYKNVVAVAVGLVDGLAERLLESAYVHNFANARAAVFAQGLVDMVTLVQARGGRAETVLGLAGSGDLYVTCLGGRNGRFGRLLGSGETPQQAMRVIGSTVEGVVNTTAALAWAERLSLDLPTARAVGMALHDELVGDLGVDHLYRLFTTALAGQAG